MKVGSEQSSTFMDTLLQTVQKRGGAQLEAFMLAKAVVARVRGRLMDSPRLQ